MRRRGVAGRPAGRASAFHSSARREAAGRLPPTRAPRDALSDLDARPPGRVCPPELRRGAASEDPTRHSGGDAKTTFFFVLRPFLWYNTQKGSFCGVKVRAGHVFSSPGRGARESKHTEKLSKEKRGRARGVEKTNRAAPTARPPFVKKEGARSAASPSSLYLLPRPAP